VDSARFRQLLVAGGIVIHDKVFHAVISQQAPRALMCSTFELAFELYQEVAQIPRTSTRLALAVQGLELDGVFCRSPRAVLLLALDHGAPAIFKIPATVKDAEYEVAVWDALAAGGALPADVNLVGPLRLQQVSRGTLLETEQFG